MQDDSKDVVRKIVKIKSVTLRYEKHEWHLNVTVCQEHHKPGIPCHYPHVKR